MQLRLAVSARGGTSPVISASTNLRHFLTGLSQQVLAAMQLPCKPDRLSWAARQVASPPAIALAAILHAVGWCAPLLVPRARARV